jgi:hypothetical protein
MALGVGAVNGAGDRKAVLVAANVANPDKDAVADLAGSVLASLRNHRGKGRGAGRRGQPGAVEAQQSRQLIVNLNRHN